MSRPKTEIMWAAGLFEGEGSFTHVGKGFSARVTSTDLDVLERFLRAVGFGRIYGPRQPSWPGSKPVYVWQTSCWERVQAVIAMLWPGLGERRRARAIEILAIPRQVKRKCK